ncbi:MAG TPA: hypothetical protein VGN24_00475 [Rhodanobacter sp.]|jgi:hypothetical protein|nr:hypothetical protein [Rhodanobacter sp.]
MILVDTCVLLDVVQDNPRWAHWSQAQVEHALDLGGLAINPIVYAEFSLWYEDMALLERTLADFRVGFE